MFYSDWMFVSSSTHIWLLQQRPISVQVDQLVRDREFELALKLAVSLFLLLNTYLALHFVDLTQWILTRGMRDEICLKL